MDGKSILRSLPRVDSLVAYVQNESGAKDLPYSVILESCRQVLETLREGIMSGQVTQIPDIKQLSALVLKSAAGTRSYSLRRVINATGVVLHTNLGRAILAPRAAEHVREIASSYSTLEYCVESGERGSRHAHIEPLICALTGAEAAMAVNNNAAAVMLALMAVCSGKEVIVSRGELVEIGGSFRVPEIMALSGTMLREVGTTNKTKPSDYSRAVTDKTAALLKVHTSNFKIIGFCEEVGIGELSALGRQYGVPVIYDLGSGLMSGDSCVDLGETSAADCIKKGVDIVCFSGDKLFGGPQAGIIAGRKKYIDAMKANQFARVVRIDKLSLAALEATLKIYSDNTAAEEIPVLANLSVSAAELERKAKKLCRMLTAVKGGFSAAVKKSEGQVGGGSAPGESLPSCVVEIAFLSQPAHVIEKQLREFDIPIITRINKGCVLIDVRTVPESDFKIIIRAFQNLTEGGAL